MSEYCVCVTFDLESDAAADFLPLVRGQARASLAEPGCHVFDVWTDPKSPANVFLYEVYESKAAFEEHLATPHFRDFASRTAALVADKRVATWARRG